MKRAIRILHIVDLQKMGGLEYIFIDLIRYKPKDMRVEHTVLNERSHTICKTIAADVYQMCQEVYFAKRFGRFRLPKMPACCRLWNRRRLIRKASPDVVLVWSQFLELDSQPLAAVPVLYYEHGLAWFDHDSISVARFFRSVTASIAVSHSAARMLQLKYGLTGPVQIVKNALRPNFQPGFATTARRLPTRRPLYLGVAARLTPLKCVGLLVLTVKALRAAGIDIKGRIAGIGPEESAIHQLVERSGMEGHVALLGFESDMPSFYKNIDMYLNTSMHEAFSLVCIEAMAYGVPVVSGAIEGPAEIIEHQVTGLLLEPDWDIETYVRETAQSAEFSRQIYDVRQDCLTEPMLVSPNRFAQAIQRLCEDPSLYYTLSCHAAQAVHTGYRFDRMADELYAVLKAYSVGALALMEH